MEDSTKILVASATRPTTSTSQACLVHIYPTGPAMCSRYSLRDAPLVIGRDDECHIRIGDESVSRRHACIRPEADGYFVVDLQSTNGTYVNEVRVTARKLRDGDYLHVGNCIYRFLAGGNVEAQYHEEIYRLSILDPLTGIYNKRFLLEFLGRELSCAVRYRRPLAFILFDVDRFKDVNDRLGHLAGDCVLRELAALLRGMIRKEDLFARYGGEEFAMVMPETTAEGSALKAEQLRAAVEAQDFAHEGDSLQITMSGGVAATTGNEWLTTIELIRQADEKLYQAKNQGRNRVVV